MKAPVSRFVRRLRSERQTLHVLLEDGRSARFRRERLRDDTVFYESFNGNGVLCNPEALFRFLLADERYARLRHIWSLSDENDNHRIRREFANDARVRFVKTGSVDYARAVLTSKYLVSNATFDRQFARREGQVFVNTWHGTPLKKMGFDIGDAAFRVANVTRTFLHADVLVSPNDYTTTTLYGKAHRLDGIYRGRILEVGSPRIDRQLGGEPTATAALDLLAERGLATRGRRVVLWAPTWKGKWFTRPEDDAAELLEGARRLQDLLGPEYFVLLKTHQVVHHLAASRADARSLLVPNDVPTNLLLAATDVLVTDYSSVFFDFLSLRRPIVFLTPDLADYAGYRGLYLEPEVWPGPKVGSVDDAATEILRFADRGDDLGAAHEALRLALTPHDDGHASERLAAAVFGAAAENAPDRPADPHRRKRMLLALPSAVSAVRLDEAFDVLDHLDLDRIDVSVVLSDSRQRWYLDAQTRLDPRIRQLVRQGRFELPPRAWWQSRRATRRGQADAHARVPALRQAWDHEWHRLFATVEFDLVVDLVGTEPFWLSLILHSGAPTLAWRPDPSATRDAVKRSSAGSLLAQIDRIVDDRSARALAETVERTLEPS